MVISASTNRPVGRNNRVRIRTTNETITACDGLDPERGVGLKQADEDRGGDRAGEIAHAADHDDDEGLAAPIEAHRESTPPNGANNTPLAAAMAAPIANTPV